MKLTLDIPKPKRLAVLLGLLFASIAFATTFQSMTDGAQTFSNDKTFNGSITINQGSTTNNPSLQVNGDAGFAGNVLFPATAAQGTLSYYAGGTPEGLFGSGGVSHASNTLVGGYCLPGSNSVGGAHAFMLTALSGVASVASGGGASFTNIDVLTDGGATYCSFQIPCNSAPPAGTSAIGAIRIAADGGPGNFGSNSGCLVPAGWCMSAKVTLAGCTTTQPTLFDTFEGVWQ